MYLVSSNITLSSCSHFSESLTRLRQSRQTGKLRPMRSWGLFWSNTWPKSFFTSATVFWTKIQVRDLVFSPAGSKVAHAVKVWLAGLFSCQLVSSTQQHADGENSMEKENTLHLPNLGLKTMNHSHLNLPMKSSMLCHLQYMYYKVKLVYFEVAHYLQCIRNRN